MPPQVLRTREATTPAFRGLERFCRGRLGVTVRTRAEPGAVPFHLALWTPTASVRETLLDAPPLSLTYFPDLGRMRVWSVTSIIPFRRLAKSPYVEDVIT